MDSFAYRLHSRDPLLNKAFIFTWKFLGCVVAHLETDEINKNKNTGRCWLTDWQLSVVPHSSCVESCHAADQTPPSRLPLSEWVIWSVTHPLQSQAKLSKQFWWAGGGNWISPLKDRPPNPHQQELREPAVHQVSSATVVRPIRFLLLHTCKHQRMHTQKLTRSQTHARRHLCHMHKQKNIHTIKQTQTCTHTHAHAQSYPSSQHQH